MHEGHAHWMRLLTDNDIEDETDDASTRSFRVARSIPLTLTPTLTTSYDPDAASAPGPDSFPGRAPVMMAKTSPIECSFGVVSATRRPSRMMWMRSASSKTCGIL